MLNDNAKAWVAALRSGDYKQGRSILAHGGRHCCLGVACRLAQECKVALPVRWQGYSSLPESVRAWLGLSTWDGRHDLSSLAEDNDNGMTFAQIAALIEAEPRDLFAEVALVEKA